MKLDQIITSVPINKTAARVVSRGERYKPSREIHSDTRLWNEKPETKEYNSNQPQQNNLTGARFGYMLVVDILDDGTNQTSKWVCKCHCGNYEIRKQKAITNEKNKKDMCQYCRQLEEKKRYLEYRSTGRNIRNR